MSGGGGVDGDIQGGQAGLWDVEDVADGHREGGRGHLTRGYAPSQGEREGRPALQVRRGRDAGKAMAQQACMRM